MNQDERVPMRQPMTFAKDDVQAAVMSTPKVGRRFSLDVTEEALATMGREALPWIVEKLASLAIHRNATVIDAAVHEKLYKDRAWLEKIVEDETRRITREFIRDTLTGYMERMEANAALWSQLATRYAAEEEPDV